MLLSPSGQKPRGGSVEWLGDTGGILEGKLALLLPSSGGKTRGGPRLLSSGLPTKFGASVPDPGTTTGVGCVNWADWTKLEVEVPADMMGEDGSSWIAVRQTTQFRDIRELCVVLLAV